MYELMLAWRHLRARRRRSLSVVTWLSVAGVALGVTALVGGFSITSGFEQAFREKVLGITAHLFVREYGTRFDRYREVETVVLSVDGVRAASPMTFNEAMFSGRSGTAGAVVKGIIPERARHVLALPEYLEQGRLDDLPGRGADGLDRVLLGAELARTLGVKAGDAVTVLSPLRQGEYQEGPATPRSRPFRVAGVFRAGFHEYDARLAYMELSAAQAFFGTGDTVAGLEIAVHDPLQAGQVADRVRATLKSGDYSVLDWRKQNKNLFASLTYQRLAILVVLSVMVILASCLVACMLIMLVLERTRDIAILKAMGAQDGGILRIFIMEGLAIGALGTVLGILFAFGLCEGLLKNGIELDPKVYGIARLPVVFEPLDYLYAATGALLITLVAAFFPALHGARMRPVDGLRETHA
jgi:lipoprotein-releasing system permease protein